MKKRENIYTYDFESKEVNRVIDDDVVANAGRDTSPTFASNGDIVFSSDRYAGNPDSEVDRFVAENELCYKVELSVISRQIRSLILSQIFQTYKKNTLIKLLSAP